MTPGRKSIRTERVRKNMEKIRKSKVKVRVEAGLRIKIGLRKKPRRQTRSAWSFD